MYWRCRACWWARVWGSHTLDLGPALTPYPGVEDISDLCLLRRRQREGIARRHGQARSLIGAFDGHDGHALLGNAGLELYDLGIVDVFYRGSTFAASLNR